jgi:hypothetical protein
MQPPSRSPLARALARAVAPSWITLGAAAGVFLAFIAATLSVSPRQLRSMLAAYPGFERMDDGYYLYNRLHRRTRKEVNIAIIGGSTTREALFDEMRLTWALTQRTGKSISVSDLASSGQDLPTSYALAEMTLCRGYQYAVIGVSLGRFGRVDARIHPARMLGYAHPDVDRVFPPNPKQRSPATSLWTARQAFNATTFKVMALYLIYDLTGIRHQSVLKKPMPRHKYLGREITNQEKETMFRKADETHTFTKRAYGVLPAFAEIAKRCGGKVLLFDTPVNPVMRDQAQRRPYSDSYQRYRRWLANVAKQHGMGLLLPNDAVAYRDDEFFDYAHLRSLDAMAKTTDYLGERLAAAINANK